MRVAQSEASRSEDHDSKMRIVCNIPRTASLCPPRRQAWHCDAALVRDALATGKCQARECGKYHNSPLQFVAVGMELLVAPVHHWEQFHDTEV